MSNDSVSDYSTDDDDDISTDGDDTPFRYDGYSVLCIPTKDEEEFYVILEFVLNADGDIWSVNWETYKTLVVMFPPEELKAVKEYLNERGIEYRVKIEDVQVYLEENERRGSQNWNLARRLGSLRIRG